jgi:hypothetical protein
MIKHSNYCGYTQRNATQVTPEATTHQFLLQQLFTIAKLRKQTRCPTTDKWIKKMWYLCTMQFYSATKKNEILPLKGKWMELENIILSEVSQAQNTKFLCSPSYADFRSRPNPAILWDLGHMLRGGHVREVWG